MPKQAGANGEKETVTGSTLYLGKIQKVVCTVLMVSVTCCTAKNGGGGFLFLHRLDNVQVMFLRNDA